MSAPLSLSLSDLTVLGRFIDLVNDPATQVRLQLSALRHIGPSAEVAISVQRAIAMVRSSVDPSTGHSPGDIVTVAPAVQVLVNLLLRDGDGVPEAFLPDGRLMGRLHEEYYGRLR